MEDVRYLVYADDDKDDQEILKEVVADIDSRLKVITVDSGEALLNYLDSLKEPQNFPCLVVIDMNMPCMNGLETLRELKSHEAFKKLTVIMFSTSDNEISVEAALQLGAADYVKKPVTYERFSLVAKKFVDIFQAVPEDARLR